MDVLHYLIATGRTTGKSAERHVARFHAILKRDGRDDGSILLQHCWAMLYELRGDVRRAVPHREREIEYVQRLFRSGFAPFISKHPFDSIDYEYLARTMHTLRGHYLAQGERAKATKLLRRIRTVERRIERPGGRR